MKFDLDEEQIDIRDMIRRFTEQEIKPYADNWDEQGIAQVVIRPQIGHHKDPVTGAVSVFDNPAAAFTDFAHPFPGQSGSRNVIRGDQPRCRRALLASPSKTSTSAGRIKRSSNTRYLSGSRSSTPNANSRNSRTE